MGLLKTLALKWKRRQILLEIEQIMIQLHRRPELAERLSELDLQLESLNNYLNG